jgi:signal transduction histidine kinase/CheY-like chemotaxis protein
MKTSSSFSKLIGYKPNSIGFSALLAIGLRISLMIAILTVGSFYVVQQLLEDKLVTKLALATEARAYREGELFRNIEQANKNSIRLITSLLENINPTAGIDFEDIYKDFGDNTFRSNDSIYDGILLGGDLFVKGSAGFIPNAAAVTPAEKKLMIDGMRTVIQVGNAYYPQLESYYFYTPNGHLFIWAPDRRGNLSFYRKEAPADFSIANFNVVNSILPDSNPDRKFVCTPLTPIIDTSTGASWTRGCQLPFYIDDKLIGGFGSSMRLSRVLNDRPADSLDTSEHMIISLDGKLVEHPRLTRQGDEIEKNLDISNSDNEDIKAIYNKVQENQDKETWISFIDENDSYVAATQIYGLGGYYIISYPRAQIAKEASDAALNILYLGLLALIMTLFTLARTLRRTVTEPLDHLLTRTKQLALGQFNPENKKNSDKSSGEISALAASTERMASELSQIVFNLEETIKERTHDMQDARDAAERASAAKSDFLANMSHEIRTPLTGVIGMLDLMEQEQLTPSVKSYLGMAQKSSNLLLNLVNDILDISRLEAGKFSVRLSSVNIKEAICETSESLNLLARQKQLSLKVETAAREDLWVLTDLKIIRQILINLVGNAIKFTETGGVTVGLTTKPIDDDVEEITIFVSDTGSGLTLDQQKKLFDRFEQVEQKTTNETTGTGLGLSITHELTGLLGGTIVCESTVGKGTVFTVVVPMKKTVPPSKKAEALPVSSKGTPLEGVCLLAVDDNPINRVIIEKVCRKMGAEITVLSSGSEMIAHLEGNASYDVLLMDINMPGLNGLETLSVIRALPKGINEIPAIALTADAIEGTADRMKQAGMQGYVTKPIDPSTLMAAITAILPK